MTPQSFSSSSLAPVPKSLAAPIHSARLSNTTILFLFAAPIVILLYGSFVFNPANADNLFLYILQVVADAISILALLGLWITVLLDVIVEQHHRRQYPHSPEFLLAQRATLDVFVTVAGEDIGVVEKTLNAAVAMEYPHHTFVLDDGQSPDVETLAKRLGVRYVTREDRQYAKAGNVNNGLAESGGEFFAIFDADQVPRKDFIVKLLPYMENPKLAMVQSPQSFANTHSFIASGTAQAQEVFYKYVCPAKNISNSAFCVGTNMIFRRRAIDEIGGIALNNSEDIWTSYRLHEKGWQTLFVNEVLAVGEAPSAIIPYFKQQQRWAKGGLSMLFTQNPLRSKQLNLDQRLQYFASNTYFLVGISILAYLLFPILYLLFDIKSLNTDDGFRWMLHYLPYFALYYSLTWLLLGRLQLSTLATAVASFYPYLRGLFSVIFNTEQKWVATTTAHRENDSFMRWTWPHVFIIILTVFSFVVGWYDPRNFWTTLFNTIWAGLNMYLLLVFLTGERRRMRVDRVADAKPH